MTREEMEALAPKFRLLVKKGRGCWLWLGKTNEKRNGYGVFNAKKVPIWAHRFMWELECGPIPEGFWVLHHCDNPPCVKPAHLYVGTKIDNIADAVNRNRVAFGKRSPSTVLSDQLVLKIRRRLCAGESQRQIAKQLGVWQSTISDISTRTTWRRAK